MRSLADCHWNRGNRDNPEVETAGFVTRAKMDFSTEHQA